MVFHHTKIWATQICHSWNMTANRSLKFSASYLLLLTLVTFSVPRHATDTPVKSESDPWSISYVQDDKFAIYVFEHQLVEKVGAVGWNNVLHFRDVSPVTQRPNLWVSCATLEQVWESLCFLHCGFVLSLKMSQFCFVFIHKIFRSAATLKPSQFIRHAAENSRTKLVLYFAPLFYKHVLSLLWSINVTLLRINLYFLRIQLITCAVRPLTARPSATIFPTKQHELPSTRRCKQTRDPTVSVWRQTPFTSQGRGCFFFIMRGSIRVWRSAVVFGWHGDGARLAVRGAAVLPAALCSVYKEHAATIQPPTRTSPEPPPPCKLRVSSVSEQHTPCTVPTPTHTRSHARTHTHTHTHTHTQRQCFHKSRGGGDTEYSEFRCCAGTRKLFRKIVANVVLCKVF